MSTRTYQTFLLKLIGSLIGAYNNKRLFKKKKNNNNNMHGFYTYTNK